MTTGERSGRFAVGRGNAPRAMAERLPNAGAPGAAGAIALAAVCVAVMAAGLFLPMMLGIPLDPSVTLLAPGMLLAVYLAWWNEKAWIYAAILSHLLFMVDSTPDTIGLGEIAFGALGLAGLALWFVKEMVICRRRIVDSSFDLLLMSFMIVSTAVTLIANTLHGGDLLQYLKEYGVVVDLLFYFPLRKNITSRRDVIMLLCAFVGVALVNGAISFLNYRERLAEAVFQWQLTASRSNLNESTSQALFVLGTTLFAYSKRLWLRLLSLALAAAGLVFLLVSFSRSPIVAALLALAIMILMSPFRNGRRVVVALFMALFVGAAAALIIFPQIATNVGQALAERVLSVASTGSDRSFNARIVESTAILKNYFGYSPILGCGFGVPYKYLDPLSNTTLKGYFVHNGYVWSLFKFGVPMALMFLWVLVQPLLRLLLRAPRRHEGFDRALLAGAVGYVLCAFIVNMTSNLFTQVSTILNIVICWVLFEYVQRNAMARDARARAGSDEPQAFGHAGGPLVEGAR
ncbi:MAG TPA: O-antigen ligase family protein [Candidatus Kapabacteria bacterium]|nr:O-antigen ligase family protein [Candidatus Kapabacteria bacterium]